MKTIQLSNYGVVISPKEVHDIGIAVRKSVQAGEAVTLDFKDVKGIYSEAARDLLKSMRGHKGAIVQMKNAAPMVKSVMMYSSGATIATETSSSTKKHFLGLWMLLLLLTLGVGQMWGADVQKNAIIYMNNATSNWTYSNIYFCINDDYGYEMSPVTNTKLLVHKRTDNTWGGYSYIRFFGANGSWGNPASLGGYSNMYNYGANLSNTYNNYGFNANNYYVIKLSKTGTKDSQASLSISNPGSTISSMNKTMTIKAKISTDGGSSYSQGNTPGELTADSYEFTAYNSCSSATSATVSAGSASSTLSVGYTANLTLEAADVEGYDFIGWSSGTNASTNVGTTNSVTVNPTSATTYYAWYREKRYEVKVATITPSAGGSATPTSWTYMGQISGGNITATPNTGYSFSGWSILSGGAGYFGESGTATTSSTANTKFRPTKSSSLKATFTANSYTFTLNGNGGSDGSVTIKYDSDAPTTISHSSRAGYSLNGYYTAASGGTKVINANGSLNNVSGWVSGGYWKQTDETQVLYAQWTESAVYYNLHYTYGTGLSSRFSSISAVKTSDASAIADNTSLVSGTGVTVSATPADHYKFVGWYSNAACTSSVSTDNPYSFTISANTSLYAKAELMTTAITLNANGGAGGTSSVTATHGSRDLSSSITKPTRTGYTLSGWYTEESGGTQVILSSGYTKGSVSGYTTSDGTWIYTGSSLTLYAHWTETKSTITVTTATSSQGTLKFGSTDKSWGTTASLGVATTQEITATAAAGFTFVRWDLSGAAASASTLTNATITLKADGSGSTGTATAVFAEDLSSPWIVAGGNKIVTTGTTWRTTADANNTMLKKTGHSTESVVYFTVPVTTICSGDNNGNFQFKIYNTSTSKWYGLAATGDSYYLLKAEDGTEKSLVEGNKNIELRAYVTGDYEFKLDYSTSTPKLTVTWPVFNQVRISAASPTDATNVGNFDMSDPVSNVRTVTRSLKANTTYTFKIMYNSDWYGYNSGTFTRNSSTSSNSRTISTSGGDMTLTTDYAGDYTFRFNQSTKALSVDFPTAYKVTYGKGTVDGSSGSCSAKDIDNGNAAVTSNSTWVKSGNRVVLTAPAAKSGYTYDGWFDNNSGSGGAITTNANCTITVSSALTRYACYHANTYTVSFNINGGSGATPDAITVTYDAPYGALPAGPTPPGAGQFAGWFTESSGGTLVTAETIVSTASNHTLYAQYEDVFSVNVDFKCGGAKIYPSTVVNASPTALRPTIIAPAIFGYSFTGWTGSNVTFADASNDTTTITATAATTVTANYAEVPTVYFKNNLEWDSVFVTFNCGWSSSVPTSSGKPYYAMTQIGTTDIYYCEIPSTYTASDYAGWEKNIAFDNKGFGDYKSTHTGSSTGFNSGEFTGRGDFDPKATLFIPYNGDTEARNGGTFYKTGCWMKYNSTESGYQLNMNEWVTGEHDDLATPNLTAPTAGGYEFSATVNLSNADYSYGFKLYKQYQENTTDLWYTNTGTINASTTTLPWHFWSGDDVTATSRRCELHTEAVGDYTITVSFATGRPMVNVEYPTQVGDWRLAYNDRIAWSGDAHAADWYIYSRVIKAKADAEDLVSFYVSKATGANAHIELQKCTAINPSTGAETWTKQGENLDLSSITGTGIYNFKVTQDGSKVATAAYDGAYEGNFYIRTDASDGGWTNYISSGKNVMTYSEYAKDYSGFTHYYMRFVETGTNIKFCIANDYSPCLTEYCIDDDYTGEYIEAKGNVRYMWDHRTNKVSRAYISGSSVVSDRFLVLEGNTMIMAEDGTPLAIAGLNANEKNFADDQNWIYEATIKAKPTARVKLTAKFNNQVQYFKGSEGAFAEGTTVQLIGGTGDDAYKIRVIYDFKTNRLVGAWLPDDETVISSDWPIDADIMVLRYHQEGAKQIKFSGSGALSDVKTVYGAMQFNKYRVNNKRETSPHANLGLSNYERDLYWISFPFEVKLSDVFGFGTYGKHWIIEYYDGKTRAANGFWADSDPNWKFVTPSMRNNGYVLKANQGYVLALDLDNMTEESDVWAYGTENVYLYFPSTAHVSDIDAMDSKTISIDQTGYECTINRGTPDGDRRVKDSYWHVLGVPSYANASHETANAWTGTVPNIDPDNWTSSAPYIYEWVPSTNKYIVHSSSSMTFLPMHSYYAQYAQTTITWTNINATPAALVARRNAARKSNYEFRMEMTLGDEVADQTYVSLRDDEAVTNEFDFSYDLSKITNGSFAKTNCIYTLIGYERAAANCLPLETEATTIVPVGVNIATAGEYTIAIPSGTNGVGVTLVDNETGIRTNLALMDYTIALEAGTQDDRFYLEISPIKHVATDIENTDAGDHVSNVRKMMVDGLLYIIKDGKVFDAHGARVK